MMQIKLQYCRAALIILIFHPFNDTQIPFKCTTFSSVFWRNLFWAWEHLAACCRHTSCELLLHGFLSNQNLLTHSNSHLHGTQSTSPSPMKSHLTGDRAGTAVTAPSGQSLSLCRCHCTNSELVTYLTFNKALLWLFLSSCLYNLWILSQSWRTRVYFPTLMLVLNFANQIVTKQY